MPVVRGVDSMKADILDITLDERSVVAYHPVVAQERDQAIMDLLRTNTFSPNTALSPPYLLHLSAEEDRLAFRIRSGATDLTRDQADETFQLPMRPMRRVIRDYFQLCDSYYQALTGGSPYELETIDMSRRSLHNEGSDELLESLARHGIKVDDATARRLFTLICVLHIRRIDHVR